MDMGHHLPIRSAKRAAFVPPSPGPTIFFRRAAARTRGTERVAPCPQKATRTEDGKTKMCLVPSGLDDHPLGDSGYL